jgi:AcrR family transcriptional regulator
MATTGTSRPGGRTARTQAAVFDATLAELVEHGYDQLSVEAVAARAGVHKTTVYRRWRTKAELVGEALRGTADSRLPAPETDDITDGLRHIGRALLATMRSPAGIAAVRALCSGGEATPEIVGFVQGFFADRITQVAPVVDRAVAHGQLPAGTDPDLLFRHTAAPIYYRTLIMGEHLTDADAELAADAALAAARAGVFSRKT